jgi:hypothetical protein
MMEQSDLCNPDCLHGWRHFSLLGCGWRHARFLDGERPMIGSGEATVAFRDRPAAVPRFDGIRNHSGFAGVWDSRATEVPGVRVREAPGVLGSAMASARWHRIGSASRSGLSPGLPRVVEKCGVGYGRGRSCAMGLKQVGSASSRLAFCGGGTAGLQIEPVRGCAVF